MDINKKRKLSESGDEDDVKRQKTKINGIKTSEKATYNISRIKETTPNKEIAIEHGTNHNLSGKCTTETKVIADEIIIPVELSKTNEGSTNESIQTEGANDSFSIVKRVQNEEGPTTKEAGQTEGDSNFIDPREENNVAEQSQMPASSSSESTEKNQTPAPVRKPNFRYEKLYRLLRRHEFSDGDKWIRAQLPDAKVTIHDHVSTGSSHGSQYISTSASWDAAVAFAGNKKAFPKRIATIDVAKLEEHGGINFIDLTDERMSQRHLKGIREKNLVRKYKEVLITGKIPADCVVDVDVFSRPDFDSEIDFDECSYSDQCLDSDDDWW